MSKKGLSWASQAKCESRAHKTASIRDNCAYVKRQRRAIIGLGILLLLGCPCASALGPSLVIDQYAHTAWTVRQGFSKGTIVAITQTQDGYLWLGTEFGLLRFDGVRAVPWQPPNGRHLPSSYIRSLLAARDGTLWIGTSEGLASWKGGKLTSTQSLLDRVFLRSLRIMRERYGPVGMRRLLGDFARFTVAVSSATAKTAVSANTSIHCMRTARGICGSLRLRACGDGSTGLPNSIRCPIGYRP